MGVVLFCVIYYIGRRLERLEESTARAYREFADSLDRMGRTELIRFIASPHVSADVKEAATDMLKETEAAIQERTP